MPDVLCLLNLHKTHKILYQFYLSAAQDPENSPVILFLLQHIGVTIQRHQLAVLGKLLSKCNILHITGFLHFKVIY